MRGKELSISPERKATESTSRAGWWDRGVLQKRGGDLTDGIRKETSAEDAVSGRERRELTAPFWVAAGCD
jgi:hypothetical protein